MYTFKIITKILLFPVWLLTFTMAKLVTNISAVIKILRTIITIIFSSVTFYEIYQTCIGAKHLNNLIPYLITLVFFITMNFIIIFIPALLLTLSKITGNYIFKK